MENEIKPMTKKELIKRIEEYKPKYMYQRYDGRIHKYEVVDNNYLVDTKTGMSIDFRSHLMLGKVSENIIDLIEVGDYVNGYKVLYVCNEEPCPSGIYVDIDCNKPSEESYIFDNQIENIVTKEQFESISYKVKE